MNEKVLVEFLASDEDRNLLIEKLRSIDYELITSNVEFDIDEDAEIETWIRIVAKINAADATMIKLQDAFLSERMRISYIPNELKDKYRR